MGENACKVDCFSIVFLWVYWSCGCFYFVVQVCCGGLSHFTSVSFIVFFRHYEFYEFYKCFCSVVKVLFKFD